MSAKDGLREEIKQFIDELIESNGIAPSYEVITEIVRRHSRFTGPDRDFAFECCYDTVAATLRDVNQAEKLAEDEESAQIEMEFGGQRFQYIQRKYLVTREGDQVTISVFAMTLDEMVAKARNKRKQGRTNLAHGEELLRLADLRFPGQREAASAAVEP